MKKKQTNFARVLDWLRSHGKIKSQKDLADCIGVTETTITRNKMGNVSHPDVDTLCKFNDKFGDIINIAYLRGESEVMLVADLCDNTVPPNDASLMTSVIAAKNETIAAMKRELAAKDELISALQQQLITLRSQLSVEKGALADGSSQLDLVERH